MYLKKSIFCQARFIFLILLFIFPVHAENLTPPVSFEKTWSIPAAELGDVVLKWCHAAGYQTTVEILGMGKMRITAVNHHPAFVCDVIPDTPIASRIQLRCRNDLEKGRKLLSAIDAYEAGNQADNSFSLITIDDVPSAVKEKVNAVVCIRTSALKKESVPGNQFSGVVVRSDGLILTTAHGFKKMANVTVSAQDGTVLPGRIIQTDFVLDLALIQVDADFEHVVDLSKGKPFPDMGEPLYSVGCPDNHGGSIFSGSITGAAVKVDGYPLFQINMRTLPGSSGSPVFDKNGHFVSIVKGRFRGTDSIGFMIPFSTLTVFLESIEE